jgi:diguanylate cyclase (GGDEF)-like protein
LAEGYLRFEGFDVVGASSTEETIALFSERGPNLLLLDVSTPDVGGIEICRWIRQGRRARSVPVILLGEHLSTADQLAGFDAGADDCLGKPFEPSEFVARVNRSLKRSRSMRGANPLTNLPGNVELLDEVTTRIWEEISTALLYVDLDNFKAFNDHYGFMVGDTALTQLSGCLTEAVQDRGPSFLGHIGGDDFAVVVDPVDAEPVANEIISVWDRDVDRLYSHEDLERGSIQVTDRRQIERTYPLMSVSIGISTSEVRRIQTAAEFAQVATEMKQVAKRDPVSNFAIDRRRRT